jgi:predicted DCC family thiol-disulfide oxidoreductase YuxK
MNTLVLIEDERCTTQSSAVLRIATRLRLPWRLFSVLLILPCSLRDAVYIGIARRRYRWFGKRDTCRLPTADERDRFLE